MRRAANAWRKSKENTDQNFQHLSSDVSSSIRREEIISNARTNWELIRSQQANIINGSQRQTNQIKKSIKSKLISNNSSSSTSTTSSNANVEGNSSNRKSTLSKNVMDVIPNNSQKSKLLRSISHENASSIISDSDCHLPPMIDQYGEKLLPKKRSASSTRPNVDSESDFVGSDEEEVKSSSRVPTTPPINPTSSQTVSPVEIIIKNNEEVCEESQNRTPPLPPIEPIVAATKQVPKTLIDDLKDIQNNESLSRTPTPSKDKSPVTTIETTSSISISATVNIESECRTKTATQIELKMETTESDKLSTISKTSTVKTETNVTSASPTNDDQRQAPSTSHNAHARNKSGVARKIGPPLIRSQTARNLSSHLNNQAVGIAANQQNGGNAASGNNAAASKKEPKKEIDKDREQGE